MVEQSELNDCLVAYFVPNSDGQLHMAKYGLDDSTLERIHNYWRRTRAAFNTPLLKEDVETGEQDRLPLVSIVNILVYMWRPDKGY